ncbi:MAG TPA: amidase family protein, partial [Polyangiales bacterium]
MQADLASSSALSLDLRTLRTGYQSGTLTPVAVVDAIYARLAAAPQKGVFIHQVPYEAAAAAAHELMQRAQRGEPMRLYGLPFAVKDNIDVAGLPTTAACPAYARRAQASATVVQRLLAEGALLIGKANLDQFATGLVGVRSPYGVVHNPFDERYISGGSSSGSAVAVARGLCSFALGTDTAGSGRVPAAFNNLVGLKPTRGMLSAHGVVPACRSLDCVSVFALTVDDASEVAHALAGFDAADPYTRPAARSWDPRPGAVPPRFRFAVPLASQLVIDDAGDRALFASAVHEAVRLGGSAHELDMTPFHATAALLYDGPWVAERLEAAGELLAAEPSALLPVIEQILSAATQRSARETFDA